MWSSPKYASLDTERLLGSVPGRQRSTPVGHNQSLEELSLSFLTSLGEDSWKLAPRLLDFLSCSFPFAELSLYPLSAISHSHEDESPTSLPVGSCLQDPNNRSIDWKPYSHTLSHLCLNPFPERVQLTQYLVSSFYR